MRAAADVDCVAFDELGRCETQSVVAGGLRVFDDGVVILKVWVVEEYMWRLLAMMVLTV